MIHIKACRLSFMTPSKVKFDVKIGEKEWSVTRSREDWLSIQKIINVQGFSYFET